MEPILRVRMIRGLEFTTIPTLVTKSISTLIHRDLGAN